MAWIFDVNGGASANGGAGCFFKLKELLKTAGWTVMSSSDGSTYNAAGDQITVEGAGAGGMNNTNAWFRIRQPGANAREVTWQRGGSGDAYWRIKYSGGPGTGFVGGTPGISQTPSATDEQFIAGSGTDAAPGFNLIFDTPAASQKLNMAADNTAPFSFYWWSHVSGATQLRTFGMLDCLVPGSELPGDVDPAIFYREDFSSGILGTSMGGFFATAMKGWILKGLGGAGFVEIKPSFVAVANIGFPQTGGQNPYNGKDVIVPWFYLRPSNQAAPNGIKGTGTVVKWAGLVRGTFSTMTVNTTADYVVISGAATSFAVLPWNGSAVSV